MVKLLESSRAKYVRQYRANAHPWPDGIGAWYKSADWIPGNDKDGDTLIATGNARARALDPWANVRAKGEPCPPLPESQIETVTPDRNSESNSNAPRKRRP